MHFLHACPGAADDTAEQLTTSYVRTPLHACMRRRGRASEGVLVAAGYLQQAHAMSHQAAAQPPACARTPARFNASALGGYACPLFARKFLAESAAAALEHAPYLWLRSSAA